MDYLFSFLFIIRYMFFILVCFFIIYSFLTKYNIFSFLKKKSIDIFIDLVTDEYLYLKDLNYSVNIKSVSLFAPNWYKTYLWYWNFINVFLFVILICYIVQEAIQILIISVYLTKLVMFLLLVHSLLKVYIIFKYVNPEWTNYYNTLCIDTVEGKPTNTIVSNFFTRKRLIIGMKGTNTVLAFCSACLLIFWPLNEFSKELLPGEKSLLVKSYEIIKGSPIEQGQHITLQKNQELVSYTYKDTKNADLFVKVECKPSKE